ncbi:type VI secretion protein VasK [Enterobacterales bacterium CwR94]|nr:type VI secretion protein VasK [Enterobacterales bacterium CwR94]
MKKARRWRVGGLVAIIVLISLLSLYFCLYHAQNYGWNTVKEKVQLWFSIMICSLIILSLLSNSVLKSIQLLYPKIERLFLSSQQKTTLSMATRDQGLHQTLCKHLHTRYGPFWRYKVRLLLVVGEEDAVAALLPELSRQQWLEGQRTVLIHGGSLRQAPNQDALAAVRTLRRYRPLDGIIHVLGADDALSAQHSDSALRSLENIGGILRWQAPVWLWQLGSSVWTQQGGEATAVGTTFPARAVAQDIGERLHRLIPMLREQGMAQVLEQTQNDGLLRLAQQLGSGDSAAWQQRLAPWLAARQQRISLRGMMFSLPGKVEASGHAHALPDPSQWQAIATDRQRGRRVGLPWEQTLGWSICGLMLLWGAGMLASFALNRHQVVSAAQQAEALAANAALNDQQLIALHALRNTLGRLQHGLQEGAPWYQRFGLSPLPQLHAALIQIYGVAANRVIRDPAQQALEEKLNRLAQLPPASPLRASLAEPGYNQLKAWLMMSRPERADARFFAQTLKLAQPQQAGVSDGLWQSLAPDLWSFYITSLPAQPQWAIQTNPALLAQVRQVLLQQIGRRNAESTLYENVLKAVRRNYADVTLEDMAPGTDPHRLFSSEDSVPGMFTRQAWEGSVRQEIEKAASARRDEIDWVLSDSRSAVAEDISPEALQARLTQRYFTDFAASWLSFLNGLRLNPAHNIADVTDQLTLMSDVRQSPLIALMNTLAWQGQTGQKRAALSDTLLNSAKDLISQKEKPVIEQQSNQPEGPLDATFGPLLSLMGKSSGSQLMAADSSLSLQTFLTRITRVRLRLQQVAAAPDPQDMLQTLAQTVFQGKSVDLTDTQQYGSLMAASLGEEWSGFGQTVFVQPLTQAWETILQPSAVSLNAQWQRAVVDNWRTAFDGRYPFAASKSDASLPMLAEFIRKDAGRIDAFLTARLGGVLQKEGSRWVPDTAHSQGLTFNPQFLKAVNQLRELADVLFTDGTQGISFELQGRPTANIIETQLMIDGQKLRYFNQMAEWQAFRWPGESLRPGTLLTGSAVKTGAQVYSDYAGTWGFIRWLEKGKRQRLDRSQWLLSFATEDARTLQWVLRTQMSDGPLALLRLRGFTLPDNIFTVDAATASQAMAPRDTATEETVTDMDEDESWQP